LAGNGSGNYNTCVGFKTLDNLNAFAVPASGEYNIAVGYKAGFQQVFGLMNGSNNIIVGCQLASNVAGMALTTGSQNVLIGNIVGTALTTGSNNIVIGHNAQPSSATVSNEIVLGTTAETLKIQGGLFYKTGGVITATFTPTLPLSQFYLINDTSGAITISLPNPTGSVLNGCVVQFRRTLSNASPITFDVTGGPSIIAKYDTVSYTSSITMAVGQFSTTFIAGANHWFQMQTM